MPGGKSNFTPGFGSTEAIVYHKLTGSQSGTVILWDVATGEPLGPPLMGNTDMETMALSPDGQTLALGSFGDNTVILWEISRESWPSRACRIANRNLSRGEWKQFVGPDIPYEHLCPNLPPGTD